MGKVCTVGGQAVMEGVMMQSPSDESIAIAVRRPNGKIMVTCKHNEPLSKKHKWMGLPFIRGCVNMVMMLKMGMETLDKSTQMLGVMDEDVTKVSVPGALEIPFALMKLAQTEEYDALIALGAVIRGETYHFELVSNESGAGITRIGLDYEIPIANGVLTTENDEQCQERIEMKARDCARCAVEMANLAKEFVSADDFEENPED